MRSTPWATLRRASTSRPESISSSTATAGSTTVTSYPGLPITQFDSVDLPEPLGPMSACTWPRSTATLMPFRISIPGGPPRRSSISRTATSDHHLSDLYLDGAVGNPAWIDAHRTRSRKARGLARSEIERRRVLRALDLARALPHLALGEAVV